MAAMLLPIATPAAAQSVEDLQRQIDELKAEVATLRAAQAGGAATAAATTPPAAPTVRETGPVPVVDSSASSEGEEEWYDRLKLRGYSQLRYNAVLSGDETAPDGVSRLRSPHDSSISDDGNFLLRRVRLVLQGDVTDNISIYLQHDFGSAVNNQSGGEKRENFGQLRDAYVDVFPIADRGLRLRFGQSKVPFGWENLQSSSNRLTFDRSDGINAGVPGERDLGVIAYYTPARVQEIWDRLDADGQKLFGNYGAFGFGVFNGQGTNRTESNGKLMTAAMATWPFELDGLGRMFRGQVLELGGSVMSNDYRPEVRGDATEQDFEDKRVGVHVILYPQPFGIQAEWSWVRGPEFDADLGAITEKNASGGYAQVMYDLGDVSVGRLIPYARWQRYRGGWKSAVNAPRLETDEIELGLEWQVMDSLELTIAYASMKRREADERRLGRAEGELLRTQLQWNY